MWKAGVTAAVAAASVIGLSAVGHLDRQAPPAPIPSAPLAKPVEATPPALPVPEPVVPAPKKAQPETRRTVTQQPVEGPATQAPAYPDHPRAIRQFAPFVRESLRQSINGEVVVRIRVEVDANGRVISAESLTQGRPLANALAATAVAAAKRWEFEPARPGETILSFAFRR